MTTPESEARPRSKGLLWSVVLLVLLAAGLLGGASSLDWVQQLHRSQFGTETEVGIAGGVLRPELGPVALAALAAGAAVLATGGFLRRVVGALVVLSGGVLVWRVVQHWQDGTPVPAAPDAPPGSFPVQVLSTDPLGPLLMSAGAVALVAAGLLVVVAAGRMPAMGAKYSAPGAQKKVSHDPDRQMWEDLSEGRDPTTGDDRGR
ncbi:Trp biosynthesis-associated membrane protein [Saccharopolyspora sp. HNM0983]|uniref:Trp biosynthesis-associated membrane protein n=1 Tax=Saccharopolyspora montiporae TaxID=2781240 RepID=A0A929B8L4_9PSEU|nr:Trp biosynthesis-associated membrane protein [Saccharopolyspora sp. HNM0983]MBE9374205.1 Trp biosynthesis-associated membrane protein [Saccharopolyspora sp. HNM0983]